jgi:hypothetical protein
MRTGADIAAPMIQFLIDGDARIAKRTGRTWERKIGN